MEDNEDLLKNILDEDDHLAAVPIVEADPVIMDVDEVDYGSPPRSSPFQSVPALSRSTSAATTHSNTPPLHVNAPSPSLGNGSGDKANSSFSSGYDSIHMPVLSMSECIVHYSVDPAASVVTVDVPSPSTQSEPGVSLPQSILNDRFWRDTDADELEGSVRRERLPRERAVTNDPVPRDAQLFRPNHYQGEKRFGNNVGGQRSPQNRYWRPPTDQNSGNRFIPNNNNNHINNHNNNQNRFCGYNPRPYNNNNSSNNNSYNNNYNNENQKPRGFRNQQNQWKRNDRPHSLRPSYPGQAIDQDWNNDAANTSRPRRSPSTNSRAVVDPVTRVNEWLSRSNSHQRTPNDSNMLRGPWPNQEAMENLWNFFQSFVTQAVVPLSPTVCDIRCHRGKVIAILFQGQHLSLAELTVFQGFFRSNFLSVHHMFMLD
jgi:hypothetical protein